MKTIVKFISTVIVIIGIVGFLSGSYFYGEYTEIPLGDINGFIVDSDDNIYVVSAFYKRVQIYNKEGEFIKNWPIGTIGGMFYMDKTENDEILITSGSKQILFHLNGTVLSEKKIDHLTSTNFKTDWRTFKTSKGVEYEVKGLLFQKIIRLNPEKTIINQGILLQLIKGPFNVWLLVVIGGFLGYFAKDKNDKNIY